MDHLRALLDRQGAKAYEARKAFTKMKTTLQKARDEAVQLRKELDFKHGIVEKDSEIIAELQARIRQLSEGTGVRSTPNAAAARMQLIGDEYALRHLWKKRKDPQAKQGDKGRKGGKAKQGKQGKQGKQCKQCKDGKGRKDKWGKSAATSYRGGPVG